MNSGSPVSGNVLLTSIVRGKFATSLPLTFTPALWDGLVMIQIFQVRTERLREVR